MARSIDSVDPLDQAPAPALAAGTQQAPPTAPHDHDAPNASSIEKDASGAATSDDDAAGAITRGDDAAGATVQGDGDATATVHERWREYVKVGFMFSKVYLTIFCLFIGLLSVYWGSMFQRQTRYKNLKMLVVSDDLGFSTPNGDVQPLVQNAFLNMLQNASVAELGHWEIANATEFGALAAKRNNTPFQEVERLVYQEKYFLGVYIAPNLTQILFEALLNGDASIVAANTISQLVTVVYESGRHYSAMNQYVIKNWYKIQQTWLLYYSSQQIFQPLVGLLSDTQKTKLVSSNSTLALLSTKPTFALVDRRKSPSSVVIPASQIVLIYAQVFSFHQFNFSLEIHSYIQQKLRHKHYVVYRILASQINSIVLALVYCLSVIAFKVPTNTAFGDAGFLVMWAVLFLFFSASGGLNEVVVSILLSFDLKQFLPPWLILNIVLNISPTYAPFALLPGVYRYGYSMPMFCTFELLRVILLDTYRGDMGRNIGVLVAWIVAMNIALVFVIRWQIARAKRLKAKEELEMREKEQKQD